MQDIVLTSSHWMFLFVVVVIFVSIGFRKGIIIPSVAGTFIIGLLNHDAGSGVLNHIIFACQTVFKALLNAGVELFDIMLLISLMIAMLKSLSVMGADQIMLAPMKKLMIGPKSAFFVLAVTMYTTAVFFWPTPAIALVGTVLIPVAIQVGLPAIGAAVAVNIAGHGMALSADPVIQGATKLTSGAAGIDPGALLPYTILFSFIVGITALILVFFTLQKDIRQETQNRLMNSTPGTITPLVEHQSKHSSTAEGETRQLKIANIFAAFVPIILLSIALLMIYRAIFNPDEAILGSEATALLGGTAVLILVLSTLASERIGAMDIIAMHIKEGFFFSIKIFAPIIPIAGFFLLGNPEHAELVLGEGTPGFLFDIGYVIGNYLGENILLLCFGITLIALLAAMDGSGFSGLPLLGSLAGALAVGAGVEIAPLAALAQVITIFAGGGTLIVWAFGACADAGISGVTSTALIRKNFIPVLIGCLVANFAAVVILS